jgi:hypothetical protein
MKEMLTVRIINALEDEFFTIFVAENLKEKKDNHFLC